MFNNLANYLLGYTSQPPMSNEPVPEPCVADSSSAPRLTAVIADDDWVLVDRDSEESDAGSCGSLESIPDGVVEQRRRRHHAQVTAPTPLLTRTSSTSSLPCGNIEESWFLTPPPCFTSTGPVLVETSPLENLLIEHPSMSVYQHSSGPALVSITVATPGRRKNSVTSPTPSLRGEDIAEDIEEVEEEDEGISEAFVERLEDRRAGAGAIRRGTVDTIRQQEKQCLKIKNAQKLQIHKACQSLKRGCIERNNKAREVNCRNHRQRRGERSQGSARSNANNNRKCC